jgi:hypothetical protein
LHCNTSDGVGAGATVSSASLLDTILWADYIYLDTDERRRFAQISHEYLVEQLQYNEYTATTSVTSVTMELNFNHPVKELIWVSRFVNATANGANQWSNYTNTPAPINPLGATGNILDSLTDLGQISLDVPISEAIYGTNINSFTNGTHVKPTGSSNGIATAKLKLNGHTRFATQNGTYFNWVQCRNYHTNIPPSPGINVYSFAIHPEDHQPSGCCNFSRIKTAKLYVTLTAGTNIANISSNADDTKPINFATSNRVIKIYAVNYNILRIMSGMGGLAYTS